jgi:hypothetical protein
VLMVIALEEMGLCVCSPSPLLDRVSLICMHA